MAQPVRAPPPPCPFDFEQRGSPLNIDMFFLAGLDAVRETNPAYPFSLPEMLRFGILHDRTVYPAPLAETSSESSLLSDGDAPFFPDAPPSSNTATAAKVAVTGPDKT